MYGKIKEHLQNELEEIKANGLFKKERIITSPQDAEITISTGEKVINFCANNYLGLSSNKEVIQAAKDTMDTHGFGMSSVRFICGTQDIHKELENKIADFYGTEDTILYAACFDANAGVFEPLLGEEDAIISDSLNHASIIDGVRLCKAARYRYENNNMADLEKQLIAANEKGARFKIIVSDGVFSMDGLLAPLDKICDLADKYDALVMIDECHATGFIGETGIGTLEQKNVLGRIDIITGTLGKALGGGMPIGALVSSRDNLFEFTHAPMLGHITTFGGHPVVCAAANAFLNELDKTDWNEVERLGKLLADLIGSNKEIKEVRRIGMMYAFDMESFERVEKVVKKCLEYGLISFWFLSHPYSFRLSPPINITEAEIRAAADLILRSIEETSEL